MLVSPHYFEYLEKFLGEAVKGLLSVNHKREYSEQVVPTKNAPSTPRLKEKSTVEFCQIDDDREMGPYGLSNADVCVFLALTNLRRINGFST